MHIKSVPILSAVGWIGGLSASDAQNLSTIVATPCCNSPHPPSACGVDPQFQTTISTLTFHREGKLEMMSRRKFSKEFKLRKVTRSARTATPTPNIARTGERLELEHYCDSQIDRVIHSARMRVEVDHLYEEGNTEEVQQIDKKNSKGATLRITSRSE
jgi:hypothetical protein